MKKGDVRWTILLLVLALVGMAFVGESASCRLMEEIILLIALINSFIDYGSRR